MIIDGPGGIITVRRPASGVWCRGWECSPLIRQQTARHGRAAKHPGFQTDVVGVRAMAGRGMRMGGPL